MASSLQVHACVSAGSVTASTSLPFRSSARSCSFLGTSSFAEPRLSLSSKPKTPRKCVIAEATTAVADAPSPPAISSPPPSVSSRPQKAKSSSKKQQVMLKFVWMEKNIGIAVDQVVPGQGTVPLSSYYFWPRKDAWEEIKTKLESKKWISKKQTILLLNQATDIINLWQQNASG